MEFVFKVRYHKDNIIKDKDKFMDKDMDRKSKLEEQLIRMVRI